VPIESSKSRNISELKRRTARPHAKCEAAPFNIAPEKRRAVVSELLQLFEDSVTSAPALPPASFFVLFSPLYPAPAAG
jgi:hypothetical protein